MFQLGLAATIVGFGIAEGGVRVRGHFRSNGTYVQPHYRSNADHSFWNNWSTAGNVNPHTGNIGDRNSPPNSAWRYELPSPSQCAASRARTANSSLGLASGLLRSNTNSVETTVRPNKQQAAKDKAHAERNRIRLELNQEYARARSDRKLSHEKLVALEMVRLKQDFATERDSCEAKFAQENEVTEIADKLELREQFYARVRGFDERQATERSQAEQSYLTRQNQIANARAIGRREVPVHLLANSDRQAKKDDAFWRAQQAVFAKHKQVVHRSNREEFIANETRVARGKFTIRAQGRKLEHESLMAKSESQHRSRMEERGLELETQFQSTEQCHLENHLAQCESEIDRRLHPKTNSVAKSESTAAVTTPRTIASGGPVAISGTVESSTPDHVLVALPGLRLTAHRNYLIAFSGCSVFLILIRHFLSNLQLAFAHPTDKLLKMGKC
jgi:hypothetical protein